MRESGTWYDIQQKGLGKKFTEDVKKTVASIKSNPYFASVKFENVRTAACEVFPYSVHYEIDEEKKLIRILSIFHFNRRPYWL